MSDILLLSVNVKFYVDYKVNEMVDASSVLQVNKLANDLISHVYNKEAFRVITLVNPVVG